MVFVVKTKSFLKRKEEYNDTMGIVDLRNYISDNLFEFASRKGL